MTDWAVQSVFFLPKNCPKTTQKLPKNERKLPKNCPKTAQQLFTNPPKKPNS